MENQRCFTLYFDLFRLKPGSHSLGLHFPFSLNITNSPVMLVLLPKVLFTIYLFPFYYIATILSKWTVLTASFSLASHSS